MLRFENYVRILSKAAIVSILPLITGTSVRRLIATRDEILLFGVASTLCRKPHENDKDGDDDGGNNEDRDITETVDALPSSLAGRLFL